MSMMTKMKISMNCDLINIVNLYKIKFIIFPVKNRFFETVYIYLKTNFNINNEIPTCLRFNTFHNFCW